MKARLERRRGKGKGAESRYRDGTIGILYALIQRLSDGQFHSGEACAATLNLSRSAVWKAIHKLRGLGIALQALPGKGYQLAQPIELLDSKRILSFLPKTIAHALPPMEVFFTLKSTNDFLLAPPIPSMTLCLAEQQSAGRGRFIFL